MAHTETTAVYIKVERKITLFVMMMITKIPNKCCFNGKLLSRQPRFAAEKMLSINT